MGQALNGADERKFVTRDLARSLEGCTGNVDSLHDARLNGTRGFHELDLLGKHFGRVLGPDGLHGVENLETRIDCVMDGCHSRFGTELRDLSLAKAADMVDARNARFLHTLEVRTRRVADIAVDVGAGGGCLTHELDDAQIILDVVIGHCHNPQAVEVPILGEAPGGGDNLLIAHREGLHLRVVLGEGAEAAIGGAGVARVANLRKENSCIVGALTHDAICGAPHRARLGRVGRQGEELGAFVLGGGDAFPRAIDDIENNSVRLIHGYAPLLDR